MKVFSAGTGFFAAAVAVIGVAGMVQAPVQAQTAPAPPPYLGNFNAANGWSFEPKLTSSLPGDVFVPVQANA